MKLNGKRIIVTGGASGMGVAAVKKFAQEGAKVVSIDINVLSDNANNSDIIYLKGDVTNKKEVTDVIAKAVEKLGGLDCLFCIAGINHFTPAEEMEEEEIDRIFAVNMKGVIFANQAVLPYLKENGGSIINFGSQAAFNPGPDSAHYSASKAAVASFTSKIAWEWGKYGIRANTVLPSAWTPLFEKTCLNGQKVTPELKAQIQAGMKDAFPLGRLGDPEEDIAPALVFLASDDSRYVTGQQLAVNGGSAMVR